jgi:hypothetical protein
MTEVASGCFFLDKKIGTNSCKSAGLIVFLSTLEKEK